MKFKEPSGKGTSICGVKVAALGGLYARTDAERFPASQSADGLKRASTLFYADFKVACQFGMGAIKDTFKRSDYKNRNYKEVTELCAVMNHLGWEYYEGAAKSRAEGDKANAGKFAGYADYFFDRYHEICAWAEDGLSGDEASFFYAVLD